MFAALDGGTAWGEFARVLREAGEDVPAQRGVWPDGTPVSVGDRLAAWALYESARAGLGVRGAGRLSPWSRWLFGLDGRG